MLLRFSPVGVLLLVVLAPCLDVAIAAEKQPPNVVLIFTDDQGYGDVGCFGAKDFKTPNLDQLAKDGRRFTNFYTAQAVCSSSRCALLTGCYPNRLGIVGALNPSSKIGIHDDETTLGEVLKSRGYATAIYGKWHLGYQEKFLPTKHGFDDYFGLPYSNDMWPNHPTAKFPPLPLIEGTKTIETNPDQSKLTGWYTERAVKFIEKNKDKPFFLYMPHSMPHVPLFASEKFKGKSKQGLYGDVIEEIDASVGTVLATLKKHDLEKNTLVIFTTDNGPWLSYGNHSGATSGLREGKGTTFEGGVRVPCIMRWPGRIPARTECHEPAMTIDVLPTLAHLSGAELPKTKIDGKNISPLLANEKDAKSPHEAYYFYWLKELQAVRSGKWKLHLPHTYPQFEPGADGKPGKSTQQKIELSLYDLEADSSEKTNVAEKHADVVKRLQRLADQMREELGDSGLKKEGNGVREPGKVE